MADRHGSFYRRSRLFFAFGRRVMKHVVTLILALIGAAILQVPAWVRPLLNPTGQKMMDQFANMLPAHDYSRLAYAVLIAGFVLACFFAWEEEHGDASRLSEELGRVKATGPLLVGGMATSIGPSKADATKTDVQCYVTIYNRGTSSSIVKNWQFGFECGEHKSINLQLAFPITETHDGLEFEKEDSGISPGGQRSYTQRYQVSCSREEIQRLGMSLALTFYDVNDQPFTIEDRWPAFPFAKAEQE